MSLSVDKQFIQQAAIHLNRFSRLSDTVWRFRCPFCGDSAKSKTLARCYAYVKKDRVNFHCHNCPEHGSLKKLLDHINPNLSNEYSLETFLDKKQENSYNYKPVSVGLPVSTNVEIMGATEIETLPDDHPAKAYLIKRLIPEAFFPLLYYTDDFRSFVERYAKNQAERLQKNEPRIIIPFYTRDGALAGFQGRAMDDLSLRYITIKVIEDEKKVFGLERVDLSKPVYVVEGAFDSMFLENSLANLDSSLYNIQNVEPRLDAILIFDNEPRNKEIVAKMEIAIGLGFAICIWPKTIKQKDINGMIISGYSKTAIFDTIKQNTFKDLRARLALNQWKMTV